MEDPHEPLILPAAYPPLPGAPGTLDTILRRAMAPTHLGSVARDLGRRAGRIPNRVAERLRSPEERVDRYWEGFTVRADDFASPEESERYLEWRFEQYPLFREFAGLWGDHDDQVILDYGCGPGNDVIGFLTHTGARKVIGLDVSETALELAHRRIGLHGVDPARYELIKISDAKPDTGLATDSIDYMQSQGVIHHTSDPLGVLRELRRVVKPGSTSRVMVYNRDSVRFHLFAAYILQIVQGRFRHLSVEEAFGKTTDGEDCPIARCWRPAEFIEICRSAGFEAEFLGGYPLLAEMEWLRDHRRAAIEDERLGAEHRRFLEEVTLDSEGYPMWRGRHAGFGGCYLLRA